MTFETIPADQWKPLPPVDMDVEPWAPGPAFKLGDVVWVPNPPTLLDRVVMAFGFKRRTPEYRTMECMDVHVCNDPNCKEH